MRNVIFTVLLFAQSLVCLSQQKTNFFKMGGQEWPLRFSEIANESYGSKSKFEIDLTADSNDVSKSKAFIWLSVTSTTVMEFSDGIYYFSSNGLNQRSAFEFNGSVFINNSEQKITKGMFSIKKLSSRDKMQFDLTLENGQTVTGVYYGASKKIDGRLVE